MISHGYLVHHGIIGQKWGVRRYQNKDGSLTAAGKRRHNDSDEGNKKDKEQNKNNNIKSKIKDLEGAIIKKNTEIGLTGDGTKLYTLEDIDEFLSDNHKGYNDLDIDKQSELIEKIAMELDKNGYHWLD